MKNTFNILLLGLLVLPALNCKDIPDPEVNPQAFERYKQSYIEHKNHKKMMNNDFPGIYKRSKINEAALKKKYQNITEMNEEVALKKIMNLYFSAIYKQIQDNKKAALNLIKNNENDSKSNEIESCRERIMKNRELCRAMSNGYQSIIHIKPEDSLRMKALAWQANQCTNLLTKMNRR